MFWRRPANEDTAYLSAMAETSPHAYLVFENGVVTYCNPAAGTVFGTDAARLIGQSPASLSPEFQPGGGSSAELAMERIETAGKQGKARFEWYHKRLDGQLVPCLICMAFKTINGQMALVSFVTDISDLVALREAETVARRDIDPSVVQTSEAMAAIGAGLKALAAGDLTARIDRAVAPEFEPIRGQFN